MKISEAYPSKYLKCADLQGRSVSAIIHNVEIEKLGEDNRPVVYFKGKQKGLVLNKTNAGTIADMYGDNTDHWEGHKITLRPTRVDFRGERVDAIRVEFVQPPPKTVKPVERAADELNPPDDLNDQVPF